jgi:hypothetical protein
MDKIKTLTLQPITATLPFKKLSEVLGRCRLPISYSKQFNIPSNFRSNILPPQ